MQPIRRILPIVGITLLLAACAGTPPELKYNSPAGMSSAPPAGAAANSAAADAAARAAAARNASAPTRNDDGVGPVAERIVFFGFDQYSISPADADLLARNARYLSTLPNTPVRVEGHADERGSSEYNLALGQRRADAVVRTLTTLGVRDSMIEAVSWGEQKPAVPQSTEEAWARNRRAEIVYSGR